MSGAPDDLQRVLDLGAALRQAQEDADRDRLRELAGERRTLLAEVARAAAERADASGQRVGDAALEEFQQTLQAALASPDAAAAIRTGRLVRSLDADGLDPVDLDDAVAGGPPDGGSGERRAPRPPRAAQDEQARRAAEERARRLEEARADARRTTALARDADAAVEDRTRDVDDLRRRIDELEQRLGAAQEALGDAESAAREAHRTADEAIAEVDRRADG